MNKCRGGSVTHRHFAVSNGTALHWAVSYGQTEIVQLLLDGGAGMLQMFQLLVDTNIHRYTSILLLIFNSRGLGGEFSD